MRSLAARQHGVLSRRQMVSAGLSTSAIDRWLASGRLVPIHPRVYALGHEHLDLRGRLLAALFYGGPGAGLSHTTAAWNWALLDTEPCRIHVSAPGDVQSLPNVAVHHPRHLAIVTHRGLRTTPVARTLVDLAGMLHYERLRKALANASFRGHLDSREARAVLRRGRRGSAALRRALDEQLPELAETLSPLEDRFLALCDAAGLPRPLINHTVAGMKVDAYWPHCGLVVELDGRDAHGHPIAVDADRDRDLRLRRAGLTPVRYSGMQVHRYPEAVIADVRRQLATLSGELSARLPG